MNVDIASVATIPIPENVEALVIRAAPPRERFSDAEFAEYCAEYPELRIEMNSDGEMIIMPPVVSEGVSEISCSRAGSEPGSKPMARVSGLTPRLVSRFPIERNVRRMSRGFDATAGKH